MDDAHRSLATLVALVIFPGFETGKRPRTAETEAGGNRCPEAAHGTALVPWLHHQRAGGEGDECIWPSGWEIPVSRNGSEEPEL